MHKPNDANWDYSFDRSDQQTYSSVDPDAAGKSRKFEAEAESLGRVDRRTDSATTLVGLIFLYLSLVLHAKYEAAFRCSEEASEMAKRLGVFGVPDCISAEELRNLPAAERRTTAFAAWGVFNVLI